MQAPRFDAVDAADPAACARFLDLAHSLPEVQRWKQFGHERLQVEPGHSVLDIGCGTGTDALALAAMVGPNGRVVGIDLSESLIALAMQRAAGLGLPVTFQQADIHAMPFVDGAFARTRIDRVLHFLPDRSRALAEAARVTAPGGLMLVTEPDWGTLVIEGGDPAVTALILSVQGGAGADACIGRRLPALLEGAGLTVEAVQESALSLADFRHAAMLFSLEGLTARAVAAGAVSAGTGVHWLRSLQEAAGRGELRCRLGGVIACARRSRCTKSGTDGR
jgi:SAM-dependent methyltransferase